MTGCLENSRYPPNAVTVNEDPFGSRELIQFPVCQLRLIYPGSKCVISGLAKQIYAYIAERVFLGFWSGFRLKWLRNQLFDPKPRWSSDSTDLRRNSVRMSKRRRHRQDLGSSPQTVWNNVLRWFYTYIIPIDHLIFAAFFRSILQCLLPARISAQCHFTFVSYRLRILQDDERQISDCTSPSDTWTMIVLSINSFDVDRLQYLIRDR